MTVGRLLLAATPLGQPSDASPRLIDALARADVVAAEDTRRVRTLAKALQVRIAGRVVSLFDRVEAARVDPLIEADQRGCDGAGGQRRRDAGDQRSRLPAGRGVRGRGPAGAVPARAIGGDDGAGRLRSAVGEVLFRGVRPAQEGGAPDLAGDAGDERRTCVFFESPRRLPACLRDAVEQLGGERRAAVCRELTKVHEEVVRGSLDELAAWAADGVLGEITVVLAGATPRADVPSLVAQVEDLVAAGARVKDACGEVAAAHPGVRSRQLYDAILQSRRDRVS